jgi:acyl-CoA reductase-like NAD-dependent aldehyde dehydrogenase
MVDMLKMFAGLAGELKGATFPWDNTTLCYTRREPIGVVGAIIPWNAPLFLTSVKLGPALVAGNSVVLKTAEQAPYAVLKCVELMQEVLPEGVVNVLSGFGEECGAPLARHPSVQKVTFTGSCDVGKRVMTYAAEKVCPVTLELGGKSPNIIFDDADLEDAVPGIVAGMRFTRQGQACTAGTRVYVHRKIYREVVDAVIAEVGRLRLGDPLEEDTDIGAIISSEQLDRVTHFVGMARATPGARILCGGRRWGNGRLAEGYFFEPTLIEGLPPESPVCQEEIFGPVAVLFEFDDLEQVLDDANRTRFGLAAAVWTTDLRTALTVANRLDAGFVQVNQYIAPRANVSYGGFKSSGIGKENTLESMLEHFTRSKTIMVNHRTKTQASRPRSN